ncbi:MAG TPA: succinate dehydrogenase cytochrome b subunit [Vicinamibacterales bacterium]|nr:succinate dehydrogenase cytochrome b subunit [Vicinamibacterales bacterium]
MSTFRRVFSSSVGTKLLIGVTGLLLFVYVLLHLAGNLLVFAGPDTFNAYSHRLISNPLIVPVEIGLALIFLIHIYKTVRMWFHNQGARPVRYDKKKWVGHTGRKSVGSTTMIYTGLITLLFVLVHLKQFKFGTWYVIGSPPIRDLYRTEFEVFASPVWVVVYVVCVLLVALHLRHGISSAFQSLGASHPRYTRSIVLWGTIVAVLIGVGFAIIPIWVHFAR